MRTLVNNIEVMNRFILDFKICFLILVIMTGFCYGQHTDSTHIDFIKVYSILSCPIPPFAKVETEISDFRICHRNVLPPRDKMSKEHFDVYDSLEREPKCQKIETVDFDSIVNFVMTSGLLTIDLGYTKPDTTSGLDIMKSGACSYRYVIETSDVKLDLLISGAMDFKLPDILADFDRLFKRVSRRYNDKTE